MMIEGIPESEKEEKPLLSNQMESSSDSIVRIAKSQSLTKIALPFPPALTSQNSAANLELCYDDADILARPVVILEPGEPNRLRWLCESTLDQVPRSFQIAWEEFLNERRGNISYLDGLAFVTDVLMWEEGFHKIKVAATERETETVHRSFYSHTRNPKPCDPYSCLLVFTKYSCNNRTGVIIHSFVPEEFKKWMFPDLRLPSKIIPIASRYWISNVYGGTLQKNVVDMYRNLAELAKELKDDLVLKLKAIVAHGMNPPLPLGLESLPLEIIENIVGFCNTADGIRLARSCKRTLAVLGSDQLWKKFALTDFSALKSIPEHEILQRHSSWKQCYLFEWKRKCQARAEQRMMRERSSMGYYSPLGWRPTHSPIFRPENPVPFDFPILDDPDDI